MAVDPICQIQVTETSAFKVEYNGKVYYFCSENCKQKFLAQNKKEVEGDEQVASRLITEEVRELLENKRFVSIGTSDANGYPCVVPKFLITVDNDFIYLADYLIGPTFENLKVNPKISLAVIDTDALIRYQINGTSEIIDKGLEYDKLTNVLRNKELNFTVERVVKGVQTGKKDKNFEIAFPNRFIVIKIKIREIVKISSVGKLEKISL